MRTLSNNPADGVPPPSATLYASSPSIPLQPDRTGNPSAEDQDTGDVTPGIDEDALDADDLDTDQITSLED